MLNTDYISVRVLEVIADALGVIGVGALVHSIVGYVQHKFMDAPQKDAPWMLGGGILILAVNTLMLAHVSQSVAEANQAPKFGAEFQSGQNAYIRGAMNHAIEGVTEGGGIYVLNSFEARYHGLSGNPSEVAHAEEARNTYFTVIEKKMGQVNYHRVLQVREDETANLATLVGPTYTQHLKKMVTLQEHPVSGVSTSLMVAVAQYSASFGMVENGTGVSYLMLQVDHRLSLKEGYDVAGNMIISDPNKTIIREFKTLFNGVEAKGRYVRAEDLEPGAGPIVIQK